MMSDLSMFQRLLGNDFDRLPEPIRQLHRQPQDTLRFCGHAQVERGTTWGANLLRIAARLPRQGIVPVTFTIKATKQGETWTRQFGQHTMQSSLQIHNGRLCETLGLANFQFRLQADTTGLRWIPLKISTIGLSLPIDWFIFEVFEYTENGRYSFNVNVSLRKFGLIVHYRGWLE